MDIFRALCIAMLLAANAATGLELGSGRELHASTAGRFLARSLHDETEETELTTVKSPPHKSPPKKSPPKTSPPKKSPPKKSPPKKSPPKKPKQSKKSPPKKSPPKKSPPKKPKQSKKSPAKKSPPKQSPPKQSPPKQSPPKQSPPKQSPPKQSPPKQSPPKQSPPKQSPPKQSPPKQSPPKQSPPKQSPAPPAPGGKHINVEVGPAGLSVFKPEKIQISAGTTVNFVLKSLGHNVVFTKVPTGADKTKLSNAKMAEPDVEIGYKHSAVFTVPGEYEYLCLPHASIGMVGHIIVK